MAAPTLVSVDLTEPTPNPDPRRPGRKTLVIGAVLLALAAGLVALMSPPATISSPARRLPPPRPPPPPPLHQLRPHHPPLQRSRSRWT